MDKVKVSLDSQPQGKKAKKKAKRRQKGEDSERLMVYRKHLEKCRKAGFTLAVQCLQKSIDLLMKSE